MRRVSTFTRAALPLLAIGSAPYVVARGDSGSQEPAGAPTTSQPTTRPNSDVLCARGRAARLAGDSAVALELLTQAVRQSPDDLDYVLELARAHATRQDWAAVEKLLSSIRGKLDADGLTLLADAYFETGRAARAANVLERGLRRQPDSETLWLALIDHTLKLRQCASALERIAEAQRHLGPTLQLQFRAAQAYYRLGQVLGRTRVIHVPGGRA